MTDTALYKFIDESNAIEGIFNLDPAMQLEAYQKIINNFDTRKMIEVQDVEEFVDAIQPGMKLRTQGYMNVQVGNHVAPRGGPGIEVMLRHLLKSMHTHNVEPYTAHLYYEWLHPFMDGNGRSGRVLYYKYNGGLSNLSFKHNLYYETLRFSGLKRYTPQEYFDTIYFEGD